MGRPIIAVGTSCLSNRNVGPTPRLHTRKPIGRRNTAVDDRGAMRSGYRRLVLKACWRWWAASVALGLVAFTAWYVVARMPLGSRLRFIYTSNMRGLMSTSLLSQGVPLLDVTTANNLQRYVPRMAGMEEIATRLDAMRAAAGRDVLVLLDGGNSLLGSDLLNSYFHGEPAARLMRGLGYDAMLPGAKEWELGNRRLRALHRKTGLTFLCASAGRPCVSRIERSWDGHRIAIYGWYEPPASPRLPGMRRTFRDATFDTARQRLAQAIASDPADFIVLLAAVARYAPLARQLPRLRLLIPARQSGLEDLSCQQTVGNVCIAPWVDGREAIGAVTVSNTMLGQRVVATTFPFPRMRVTAERQDPTFQHVFAPFETRLEHKLGPAFCTLPEIMAGCAAAAMPHPTDRKCPTPAGEWVCEMLRDRFHADVAILNHLAMRASIGRIPDVQTSVVSALPYGDHCMVLGLRGSQLTALMRRNALENRRYLQVAGIKLFYDVGNPASAKAWVDGAPIDPARIYRVATIDYLAQGARGQEPVLGAAPRLDVTNICLNHLMRDTLWDRFWLVSPTSWVMRRAGTEHPPSAGAARDLAAWGCWPAAWQAYQAELRKRPDDLALRAEVGAFLLACGLPERALELVGRTCPLVRGRAHLMQGNMTAATADFDRLCRLEPQDLTAWLADGWAAFASGDATHARRSWERARRLAEPSEASRLDSILELVPRPAWVGHAH